ncbi:hypothetical protein B0O99DRAFT_654237 [Bisporella sp. PMI_857]|nr:hypothetical protein B0O99DRAFT_654237 [Bisporella sp. PMI_857]
MAQDFGSPRHGGSRTPDPPRSVTTFYQDVTNQRPHTPSVHPGPPALQQPFYPQPAPASTSNALLPTQPYTDTAVPSSRRTQTMLIVGIDFGAQDSAVAFAFTSNTEAQEDIITEWPGSGNYSKPRVPTVLYYDQYQKVVGWGTDIADAITPMGYPKPNIQKVEWFKLQLMDKGNNYVDFINIPPLPPGKSAIDVTADFLFKLRQAIRTQLRKRLGAIFDHEERNIHFSFTVPTMFNEATQLKLRNAIVAAGFVSTPHSEYLSLISEPKSLAMYCTKTGLLNLKAGDAFIVVDCGGGTVDLIAYEVEDELPLTMKELTVTTGDSCGSTATNRNFNNILQSKLRLMRLPQGSKTASRVYAKCTIDFENRIRHDFRNNGQKWAVDVGIEADYPEVGIEEGYMVFTNDEVLACFEPVVNRIIELIRNQIIDVRGKHKILQNILVAGTFGASEHLFQQIKLHMPPELMPRIVRPMDSANAKSKGAVANLIVDRVRSHKIARRNYFVDKLQPFQNGLHPDYYFTGSPDGKQYCKYTHQLLIKKGERVKIGEPLKIVLEKFLAPSGSLVIEDTIYTCDDDEYPAFTTNPRLEPWGTCLIDLSKRRADLESLKVQTANGAFYHIQYALYTTLNDMLVFEAVFMGEVIGAWFLAF